MDMFEPLTKVQLLGMKDVWEPFDIIVDGNILKWYAFSTDMNKIWHKISYQCYNNKHIACISNLDYNAFGTDGTAARFDLYDMDATLCNELCQFYSHFAVSGSKCYCDNGDVLNINQNDVIPNSFCRTCPDLNGVDFCGDGLRNYWNIYNVTKLNLRFPASFTITKTDHNVNKGQYKVPLGYQWKSKQSANETDINCWKFEWDGFIGYTLHYQTFGLLDTKIGERAAIYHKSTGVLLRVSPLSQKDDEQISNIIDSTLPSFITIQYTMDNNTDTPYTFSDAFSIPSDYIQTIMNNYLGCFVDREDNGDMFLKLKESNMLSYEDCNLQCATKSFPYLGLRYDANTKVQQCFCGFNYGSFGSLVLDSCNYFCRVSPQYRCGSKLNQYQSQKILSVYSTILPSDSANTPSSIIMSRNHIFEGYWKDSASSTTHQICQWNNDYIIQPTNNNKISTIEMLNIPKLHECGNNNAHFEEQSSSSYHLLWINGENWIKQNEIRYILPSLPSYTLYASPIISAEAITSDDIVKYLSPRYKVTIAHQGFAKEILADSDKYEIKDAEEYREMIELLYDPKKKSNKKDPFKSVVNKMSLGFLFDESADSHGSHGSLARHYDFQSPFNFNKQADDDMDRLSIHNLLAISPDYTTNAEIWEFVGRIIGSDYYEMDVSFGKNKISNLDIYYCDELQREEWTKLNNERRNSLSYMGMVEGAICVKGDVECNLVGIMLDIDTNDVQSAVDLANWLNQDENLSKLDSYFARTAYKQLGWDWYSRPFALRNKAIFQIVADPVPTFQPTKAPLPLKNYQTVLELYGIIRPISIDTYIQNAPIFEILLKDILVYCIKSETIRIRQISITNNNTAVQFDPSYVPIHYNKY